MTCKPWVPEAPPEPDDAWPTVPAHSADGPCPLPTPEWWTLPRPLRPVPDRNPMSQR
jgi:hypothetical protein